MKSILEKMSKQIMEKNKTVVIEAFNKCDLQSNLYENNPFRVGSSSYYAIFMEARNRVENGEMQLSEENDYYLNHTDIGKFAYYDELATYVPLDSPMVESINEDEDVELNDPKRGGSKKFYVYVKNDKGNVVKVSFGDPNMSVKFDDEEARKSFNARHDCASKKDKTKAGYWSCNLPRYAKQLGLSGGGNFFW